MIVRQQRWRRAPRGGFTLMELLVVAAILVLLAGIGTVTYTTYLESSKRSVALINVKTLTDAAQSYYVKNGEYPPNLAALTGPGGFIEADSLTDPWNQPYQYTVPGTHHQSGKPDIWSNGPKQGDQAGQIGNWMKTAN